MHFIQAATQSEDTSGVTQDANGLTTLDQDVPAEISVGALVYIDVWTFGDPVAIANGASVAHPIVSCGDQLVVGTFYRRVSQHDVLNASSICVDGGNGSTWCPEMRAFDRYSGVLVWTVPSA